MALGPRSMNVAWYQYACCGHPTQNISPRSCTCAILFARSLHKFKRQSHKLSIHFLHLRCLVRSALDLLERREIIIAKTLVVIVDAQAEFDHTMDSACELRGLVQVEA